MVEGAAPEAGGRPLLLAGPSYLAPCPAPVGAGDGGGGGMSGADCEDGGVGGVALPESAACSNLDASSADICPLSSILSIINFSFCIF